MDRKQKARAEMLARVRNFGVASRDVFPESSVVGQRFDEVAAVVKAIDDQLLQHTQARTEARKVRVATRKALTDAMKAVVATGQQASAGESGPHPFRMPKGRSATALLTSARYFLAEATRRQEKFAEFGISPTFLADFERQITDLAHAVTVQQDSRAARRRVRAGLKSALTRGNTIVRQLDVMVANALRGDEARLGQWQGARSVDATASSGPSRRSTDTSPVTAPAPATNGSQQGGTPAQDSGKALDLAS